jgi:hypothetical protein
MVMPRPLLLSLQEDNIAELCVCQSEKKEKIVAVIDRWELHASNH